MNIGNVKMLSFLWLALVPVLFFLWARYRRKRALRLFIEADLLGRIPMTVNSSRRLWKLLLVIMSIIFIVFSLSRPAWNPKPQTIERRGRDIVFVLDVSKSMLAEDLAPNRLNRAKFAIKDMIKSLKGDRVALVVFAGSSVLKCPLTLDYGFFRQMLDGVDVNSISRGGTLIGDAIRKALEDGFGDQEKKYKDILLITDGEDHDSFPVQAAEEAFKHGVRIIAIGLGDENQGKRIPITDDSGRKVFLKYKGREVWSKLDATTLRKMANATDGGKYLNVSTGNIDLGEVYRKLIAGEEKRKMESKTIKLYEEKFQIFLAIAIALLILEMFVSERKKVKNESV